MRQDIDRHRQYIHIHRQYIHRQYIHRQYIHRHIYTDIYTQVIYTQTADRHDTGGLTQVHFIIHGLKHYINIRRIRQLTKPSSLKSDVTSELLDREWPSFPLLLLLLYMLPLRDLFRPLLFLPLLVMIYSVEARQTEASRELEDKHNMVCVNTKC